MPRGCSGEHRRVRLRRRAVRDALGCRGAVKYEEGLCPNAEAVLRTGVRVPINEFHTETDIEETALAIHKVASHYAEERERP